MATWWTLRSNSSLLIAAELMKMMHHSSQMCLQTSSKLVKCVAEDSYCRRRCHALLHCKYVNTCRFTYG